MLVNLWLAYMVFRRIGGSAEFGVIATLLYCLPRQARLSLLQRRIAVRRFLLPVLFSGAADLSESPTAGPVPGRLGDASGFWCVWSVRSIRRKWRATLPVIVLLYELLFHPPDFRSIRALFRWCFHEGRMALLGALCVLIYIPAKLGANGSATDTAYIPSYTLGALACGHRNISGRFALSKQSLGAAGRHAVDAAAGVAGFFVRAGGHRALDAIPRDVVRAAVLRDRAAAGIFYPAPAGLRALSAAGWDGALRGGACLVRFKESLCRLSRRTFGAAAAFRRGIAWSPSPASVAASFVATAAAHSSD